MSQKVNQTRKIYAFNLFLEEPRKGEDFSLSKREDFHLERDGSSSVKVVSDGFTDYQKLIQSEAKNAGLANIMKFQAMRYGTLQNAIVANDQKKLYADVSNIPDSVGEQAELVARTNAEIEKLCKEMGLTKEQLLNLTPEKYVQIKQEQAAQAAQAAVGSEGGAE